MNDISLWVQRVSMLGPVITGIVGFLGVIITLWYNARSARKLEKYKYDREREGIAAALRAELRVLKKYIEYHLEMVDRVPSDGTLRMRTDFYGVSGKMFDVLAGKLGYLQGETIEAVCECYIIVRRIIDDAKIFEAAEQGEGEVTVISSGRAFIMSDFLKGALLSVNKAIDALSNELPSESRSHQI